VSSGLPAVEEPGSGSWSSADLAGVLSALCCECRDLAGVLACSIVVNEAPHGVFSAAASSEWACLLDDFQLSEEAGPTWECCQTGKATQGDGLGQRGLTGAGLLDHAPRHGIVGCRSVPLLSRGEILGALTLYWGASTRDENLLTPGVAVAAMAAKAIEFQRRREAQPNPARRVLQATSRPGGDGDRSTSTEHEAPIDARDTRALARDERAAQRDARANARDARAAVRDEAARARETADPEMAAMQVEARRDRFAAARDRFAAKSDRAAARLDRVVSAIERVESSIDGLTGAYRRDAGMRELEHEVARARRTGDTFVLAFVDVNNLKARNDTLGHLAGDQLLRKIADTLRANVRSYDLVVRYGGDEFVCGFPALDVNDAAERFARINGDLAATAEASVAFGLAELEMDDSLADLITRADTVMYANRYERSSDGGNAANTAGWISSRAAPGRD
jgi:diguanylate cyclase (GGDEF)-like protein